MPDYSIWRIFLLLGWIVGGLEYKFVLITFRKSENLHQLATVMLKNLSIPLFFDQYEKSCLNALMQSPFKWKMSLVFAQLFEFCNSKVKCKIDVQIIPTLLSRVALILNENRKWLIIMRGFWYIIPIKFQFTCYLIGIYIKSWCRIISYYNIIRMDMI